MRLHDTLLGLLVMALAAAIFVHAGTFPELPGQRYGPSLFPRVIAVGLFMCGLLIAWRGWGSGARWLAIGESLRGRRGLSFAAMLAAIVFYLVAAEHLGFLPTAAFLVAGLALWFGVRPIGALVLGVVAAALIQWFFGSLMRVPLPRGWFMQVFG